MVGSKCNLKIRVRSLGYPIPLQTGGTRAIFFGQLRNSTANLKAYIFGTKHDIPNRPSALQATSSQNDMNFGPQTASNWKWVFTHPS